MEVYYLDHPHYMKKEDIPPLAMALGFFDGVHLGHQKVIAAAKREADQKGYKSAVMSFNPHPSVVLGRSVQHVQYITPLEEKIRLIHDLGIDYFFIVRFTEEFANLLPQEYVDRFLIDLNVKHVVAGFDYTYGRMGKGTMETLPFHAREMFTFSVVDKLQYGQEKISSTAIRGCIHDGRMEQLPHFLGRFYTTKGKVIHGEKRGRTIGFPTANIDIHDDYLLPPTGVYAVKLTIEKSGETFKGVCNVGYKPTFHKEQTDKPSIEVFIFDFDRYIYDEKVTIEWHRRLRSEQKFSGIDELIAQIEKDKAQAHDYFEKIRKETCILS
ncbi:bifunctional riboflavin kinase/FAD synthetase [Bacillus tuaregi]|uniref:bifunctional riboflavin kinase/FAD synthetase n=1 Tax=Bacillus tuaregi TaxID=1816695 RepID=UPI0008F84F84|nr:bifunctional riboflavin kinase/FAD synthetase [Bacillus tuaregi]